MEAWGVKAKIIRNAARELWVGPQTRAISVRCTCTESLVLQSLRGPAKSSCCGQCLQIFSTFATKRRVVLTLQYAKCLENVSMEMWGWPGRRQQGRQGWCGPRYKLGVIDTRACARQTSNVTSTSCQTGPDKSPRQDAGHRGWFPASVPVTQRDHCLRRLVGLS